MSERMDEEPEFWLPAEFLTDEEILMDNKDNLFNFDQLHISDNVELTRQLSLHKPDPKIQSNNYSMVGSPQSTLFQFGRRSPGSSSDGSPNGPSQVSSPTSHFTPTNNSLDLIYQAAAQVSYLKRNGVNIPLENNRNLLSQQNSSALYNSFVIQRVREEQILKYQQQQRANVWYNNQFKNCPVFQQPENNRFSVLNFEDCLVNNKTAWPSSQYMMQQKKSGVFQNGGSGNGYQNCVRKPSAGTGVFLPRRYENKCGGVQTKTNKNIDVCPTSSLHVSGEMIIANGGDCAQARWLPSRGGERRSDYGELCPVQLAQKNARIMMNQRRSTHIQKQVVLGHELGLPQEWTY